MADDEATDRGATGAARGSRPAPRRATTGSAGGAAKKAVARRAASKKATVPAAPPESPPKKSVAERGASKKAPAKGAVAKKVVAEPAPAKKAPAQKAPAQKAAGKKAPGQKAAGKKAPGQKAPGQRAAAATPPPESRPEGAGASLAGRAARERPGRKAAGSRLAAEQTFAGDWEEPAPEPVREDPAARVRALLRAAAADLEGRDRPAPAPAPAPARAPARAPERDASPTRVLVAPPAPAEEPEPDDQAVEDEEGEWAPPDVIEAEEPPQATPPPPPAAHAPPPPDSPPPPSAAPPPAAPPAWAPPEGRKEGRGGPGLSLLAIVLALVVPLFGAVIGFVLANRARRRNLPLAGVARVVAVVAFVAWLIGGGSVGLARARDQGVDYSKLKVGDCFDSSSTNEVRGVKVKPCSKSHNSEIFFLVTHPAAKGDAYPGKDPLVQFAADACLGQPLTDYLGVPLEASKLKDFEIVPQASAWKEGRRVLVCGLDTGGQGKLTGSVKGTRR